MRRQGYDKSGYDKVGYDKDGYDRFSRDKAGYNRQGFDKYGECCSAILLLDNWSTAVQGITASCCVGSYCAAYNCELPDAPALLARG